MPENEACLRGLQVIHRDCVASSSTLALLLLLLAYQHPRLRKRVCSRGGASGCSPPRSPPPIPPGPQAHLFTQTRLSQQCLRKHHQNEKRGFVAGSAELRQHLAGM